MSDKAKYWTGVLYTENMLSSWQEIIADKVQLPFAYCIHDKDVDTNSEVRKVHLHLILCFPNTTTYKHAFSVFNLLSADGRIAINKIESIVNIRHMYNYLIHDTESCRKQNKHLYDVSERITGNNFDIGSFEQLGVAEKNDICKELCNVIMDNKFLNFGDFYIYVINKYTDTNYFEILKTYSGLFERLTKSNYQKYLFKTKYGTDVEM